IIAWTLVRYEFPARKLIDALIDMPFALPTAVSGIALTTVFAHNGWIGRYLEPWGVRIAYTWLGVTLALTLITMPFVVRAVQPALLEVQHDLEDAAETLGAGRIYVARRIILPTVLPSLLTGFTLAFARALGEYGSVAFLAALLLAPLATVFAMAFQRGLYAYLESFADPDTAAAIRLTLTTAAVAVPINTVFGLAAAWAIAKFEFRGKSILITLIDLPLA